MDKIEVWFDREGDFLEVSFSEAKGYFRDIGNDIFERVDEKGRVIGFAIFNFTRRDKTLVEVPLELEKIIA